MQVLLKSRHPQATDLRELTERRVRFVLRRLGWMVPRADVVALRETLMPNAQLNQRLSWACVTFV